MKQTWSFQRWRRRYFRLKGHKLYYAKDSKVRITAVPLAITRTSHTLTYTSQFRRFRSVVVRPFRRFLHHDPDQFSAP